MTTAEDAETPALISVTQEALWLMSRLHPRVTPYNEAVSIRKHGPVEPDALRGAFNALVRRYDTWHSVIRLVDGEARLVAQPAVQFALPLIDLSGLDAGAAERQAVRLVSEAARVPYDLGHGPLIRPRLLRFPADEHRLYLAMHHSIFDGVSLARTALAELIALYDARCDGSEATLPQPPPGYVDFARWERHLMTTDRGTRRLRYWRQRLTPTPPQLHLPTDNPRPATARFRGGTIPAPVSAETTSALRAAARSGGHTEFQAFAAIWAAFLHRVTGETDIAFATPADLRRRREFEPVIGFCLTPIVLRVDLGDDPTVSELMTRLRNDVVDALDHVVPFERVVRDLAAGRTDGANPIYQTMMVFEPTQTAHDPSWSLHQIDPALADGVGVAKLDLELQLEPLPNGSLGGQLNYDRDLFTAATAQRLIAVWRKIVDAVAEDPGVRVSELQLTLATDADRLAEFNATNGQRPPASLSRLFVELAARQPNEPAITAAGQTATYEELHRAALAGAAELRAAGVGGGDVVAVCLEPSVGLVAAALAGLHAGAAVLLLDPAAPADALATRATAADCSAVYVAEAAGSPFPATRIPTLVWTVGADTLPPFSIDGDADPDLACMLSGPAGSSEAPAVLSRNAVETLVSALVSEFALGPGDTVLSLPEMLYASPYTELWPALLAGGRLVLASPEVAEDGAELSKLIRAETVTFMHATSTRWDALIETGLQPARGLGALSDGDGLSRDLADRLLECCRVLWSGYAPAAPGAYCTLGRVLPDGPATVGRPIANHRAHVVDSLDRPVPVGFVGELLLHGPLATPDDPGSSRLVAEPGGEALARRTGRRARWLGDGRLALSAGR